MATAGIGGLDDLRRRLSGAKRIAVIGIGDELSPVDRPGMVAAREIMTLDLPGIRVFLAGTVPETMTGPVRAYRPDHILLLDSADMGIPPGTAEVIAPAAIPATLFSTHSLPLSVVMEYLERETGAAVTLLGIQPDTGSSDDGDPGREPALFSHLIDNLAGILREAAGTGITD
mgnify:CR=1 FL=1